MHHDGKLGQELKAGAQGTGRGGLLLIDLLLMAFSACFLLELRTTCPGVEPPTVSWALPYQLLIEKMLHRLAYCRILWRCFLCYILSSQMSRLVLSRKNSANASLLLDFSKIGSAYFLIPFL